MDRILAAGVFVVALAVIQFLVFTGMAMNDFKGGNNFDRLNQPAGYVWSKNFLSDLGTTKTRTGSDNAFSASCFNNSIIVLGSALAVFFVLSVKASQEIDPPALIIAGSGVVSSLGLVGIGLTPWDQFFYEHHIMLGVWILPLPVIAVTFTLQCFRSQNLIGNISGSICGLAAIGLIGAILAFAFAPSMREHIVMQKLLVGVSIAWFALIVGRIAISAIIVITYEQRRDDRLADQYMQKIDGGHLQPYRQKR